MPETMSDRGTAVGLIDASENETVGSGVPAGGGATPDEGPGAGATDEPVEGGGAPLAALFGGA